jgi:hypothetical protein
MEHFAQVKNGSAFQPFSVLHNHTYVTEEISVIEMRIWCINIGIVWILHTQCARKNVSCSKNDLVKNACNLKKKILFLTVFNYFVYLFVCLFTSCSEYKNVSMNYRMQIGQKLSYKTT